MKYTSFLLFFALLIVSCGETATSTEADATTDETKTEETTETTTPPIVAKYKLTPFNPSPSFPGAKISNMQYEKGMVRFDVENYELGSQTADAEQKMCANSGEGQHIHFIVNNEPYMAKYEPKFEAELLDGEHHILAFLSRSYHESIKTADAHIAQKVTIKNKAIAEATDITEPMLFYSRPKGTYTGKANTDKVMLDFYPVNVNLSTDNYRVRVNINGEEEVVIDKWQPYYIEGLPMGDNKITLTLVDADGDVATPHNPMTRTFTLQPDPIEEE